MSMSDDTAQPVAAETDPNAQLANAASAFLTLDKPPRDESGKFAPKAQAEEMPVIEEGDFPPIDDQPDDEVETDDGSDDAQPDPVEMPKSWSKDDEEAWNELPPAAQAKIAEREGQRDAAINAKFQEFANARKAAEAKIAEANSNREKWAQDYDALLSHVQLQKPNPAEYGLGTGNYDREGYDLAAYRYEQQSQVLDQLRQQRETIRAQQEAEADEQLQTWKAEHEATYAPRLLTDMPELQDPTRNMQAITDLVTYAVENGISEDTFQGENQKYITSAELHVLWKARQYDAMVKNKGKPVQKPASPALRPSVATPRTTVQKTKQAKAHERLRRTGSLEDAAAIFKTAF